MKNKILISCLSISILLIGVGCSNIVKEENKQEKIKTSTKTAWQNKELVQYNNTEKNYTFKHPEKFKIKKISGEFYKGKEYPIVGIQVSNPNTGPQGSFREVRISIYDQNWFSFTWELENPQRFDFDKKSLNNIQEVRNTDEFKNSKKITVNGTPGLKKKIDGDIYIVLEHPSKQGEFVVLHSWGQKYNQPKYKKAASQRKKLLNLILSTFKFK